VLAALCLRYARNQTGIPLLKMHSGLVMDLHARRAGLVRDGRASHYSADPQGLAPLIGLADRYAAFWRDRFDRLESLLNRMDQ
jgi:hypothetical protein